MIDHLLDGEATLLRRAQDGTDRLNRPTYAFLPAGIVRVHRQKGSGREFPTSAGKTEVAEWSFFASPGREISRFDRFIFRGDTYDLLSVEPIEPPGQGVSHYEIQAKVV